MHRPFSVWVPGTDPSSRILEALSAAIRAGQTKQRYPLTGGTLVHEQPRRYAYQFSLLDAGAHQTARTWCWKAPILTAHSR